MCLTQRDIWRPSRQTELRTGNRWTCELYSPPLLAPYQFPLAWSKMVLTSRQEAWQTNWHALFIGPISEWEFSEHSFIWSPWHHHRHVFRPELLFRVLGREILNKPERQIQKLESHLLHWDCRINLKLNLCSYELASKLLVSVRNVEQSPAPLLQSQS